MKNEIDLIFPKPADALKGISDSIDKINGMAMAAENKDEILPSQVNKCEFCDKPAMDKISILEADDVNEEGYPDAYRVNRWLCEGHIRDWEESEGIFEPGKYL